MNSLINLFMVATSFAFFSCGSTVDKTPGQFGKEPSDTMNNYSISKDTVAPHILFLKNGINYIDLNGDNMKDMVISGFRNNSTAHVFSYYTFYIFDKDYEKNNAMQWNIVEIKGNDKYDICSYEGADGAISDIVFVKNGDGQYQLLKADREFGESFADSRKVTFSYYSLSYDSTENRYGYNVKSQNSTKNNYIDVKDAISQELK